MRERARLRRLAGLTQTGLAKRIGKTGPQICLWEKGEIDFTDADIQRIAAVIERELNKQPPVSSAAQILGLLAGVNSKPEQSEVAAVP